MHFLKVVGCICGARTPRMVLRRQQICNGIWRNQVGEIWIPFSSNGIMAKGFHT